MVSAHNGTNFSYLDKIGCEAAIDTIAEISLSFRHKMNSGASGLCARNRSSLDGRLAHLRLLRAFLAIRMVQHESGAFLD